METKTVLAGDLSKGDKVFLAGKRTVKRVVFSPHYNDNKIKIYLEDCQEPVRRKTNDPIPLWEGSMQNESIEESNQTTIQDILDQGFNRFIPQDGTFGNKVVIVVGEKGNKVWAAKDTDGSLGKAIPFPKSEPVKVPNKTIEENFKEKLNKLINKSIDHGWDKNEYSAGDRERVRSWHKVAEQKEDLKKLFKSVLNFDNQE